jgi:iron complex outermembrane recepter protein
MLVPSVAFGSFVLAVLAPAARARAFVQGAGTSDPDADTSLVELSLEDLMEVEVSVASRHGERLMDVPAAVYVLTGDELRRQGVQTIQDALRMVPGFHVAQWRTQGWDVASRGFTGGLSEQNQSFMSQLLLMVDGVSLYSPAMAGIWWPLLDIPIQDIERIEIIRGPAGTLWGTNAMNGVVHVITKHARDTQGARADALAGTTITSGDASYGSRLGDGGWFRTWVSSTEHDGLRHDRDADWHITSVGWRSDWDLDDAKRARVFGTIYGAEFGPTYVEEDDQPKAGGFVSAMLETGEGREQERLQAWYWLDHQSLPDLTTARFRQDLQTLDLEWTRRRPLGDASSVSYGLGGRVVQAEMGSEDGYIDFDPEFQRIWSARAFVQGEFDFASLDSKLVAGVQAEESDVHDPEVQPNVRWLWRATEATNLWASVSRAVRTSSIEERDIVQHFAPSDPPFFVGKRDFDSEELLAYELGLRMRISEAVTADLTAFFNDYDDLQTFEDLDGVTLTYGNEGSATARGFEAAIDASVTERLRLRSSYTWFEMEFEASDSSLLDGLIEQRDDLIPVHHASLRAFYDLGEHWELDGAIYYVDRLPYFDVDSYVRADVRLGWNPKPGLRFSAGVQNLNDPEHPEAGPIEVERVVWVGFSASF